MPPDVGGRAGPHDRGRGRARPTSACIEGWEPSLRDILATLERLNRRRASRARAIGWRRVSRRTTTPTSSHPRAAPPRRRDDAVARRLRRAALRRRGLRRAPRPSPRCPGHFQHTLASLRDEVRALHARRRRAASSSSACPPRRTRSAAAPGTPTASPRWRLRALRDEFADDLVIMADLCLDEYTSHGHCGVAARRRHRRQRRHPRALRAHRGRPGRGRRRGGRARAA